MATIRHRVGITAPQARVFEALTTTTGLAGWWTREVDGDPEQGGRLRFFFGTPEPSAVMEVVAVAAPDHVAWRCVAGPDEWVGTTLTFQLTRSDDETVVLFHHADWREPVDFMHHCSTKWAVFLVGMKGWLEGAPSIAFPDDGTISNWG